MFAHTNRSALALLLCVLALTVAPAPVSGQGWPSIFGEACSPPGTQPTSCSLGDSSLSLVLVNGSTGFSLQTLSSAEAGDMQFEEAPLFKVILTSGGTDHVLSPSDFADVRVLTLWTTTFLIFRHQAVVPHPVTVVAKIRFSGDAFDFDIWVNNANNGHALREICYPIMRPLPLHPNPAGTLFSDILVAPFLGGSVNPDPWTLPSLQFPNPGTPMQLFTIFDRVNNRALYWQTKDRYGFRKDYRVTGRGTSTEFEVIHFPINNHLPGSDYFSPFSFTLSSLLGNWYEAAVKYRSWALAQPWAQRGPITQSSEFSERMKNVRLFTLMYPDHEAGFDDFPAFAADGMRVKQHVGLQDDQLLMLWADWHQNLFNVNLPDFLPPRSTVETGVGLAHATGLLVSPYVNINLWSRTSTNFNLFNAEQYVWTRADGTVPEIFVGPSLSQLIYPHVRINPARSGARNARTSIVADVLSALPFESWDGIYLDTWSGVVPELDYNPNLFLKGGTPFWMLGQRTEGDTINAIAKGADSFSIVYSEIPLENVIDKLELVFYDPFQTGTIQLPVWETVYHGYILTSDLSATVPQPTPGQVAAMLPVISYDYHLGKVVGLSNFFADTKPFIHPDPGQNQGIELLNYVRSLVQLDAQAAPYRLFGTRLKPLSSSISRSMETLDYFFFGPPVASSSMWQAANDDVGIVVTNHSSVPQTITLDVDFSDYQLAGDFDLFFNLAGTRLLITSVNDSFTLPAVVPPNSAQLLELIPR